MKLRIPRRLLTHTVLVEPYAGRGRAGATYGEVYTAERVYAEGSSKRTVNAEGEERMGRVTVYFRDHADAPAVGSRITWRGGVYTVVERESYDTALGGYSSVVCT